MHWIEIILLVSWPVLIYLTYRIILFAVRDYEKGRKQEVEKSA